jgi:hypothetical protein
MRVALTFVVAAFASCSDRCERDRSARSSPPSASADGTRVDASAGSNAAPNLARVDGKPIVFRRAVARSATRGKSIFLTLSTDDGGCDEPERGAEPAFRVHLTLAPVLHRKGPVPWAIASASVSGEGLAVSAFERRHEGITPAVEGDATRGVTLTLPKMTLEASSQKVGEDKKEVVLEGTYRAQGCGAKDELVPADGGTGTPAPQKALRFSVGGMQHEIVSALTTTRDGRRELLLSTLPRTCGALETGPEVTYDVRFDGKRPATATLGGTLVTWSMHPFEKATDAPSFVFGDEKSGAVSIEVHGAYEHARADNDDALPVKIDGTIDATVCRDVYP